jgi:flavin reductase (DIM6/NTAB) family NADH-FMN oxidoreductase RutF
VSVTPEAFRRTLGLFATGVTVVTTAIDDALHGMTANAFSSVSLDPPLVLVCVARRAGLHELLPRSKAFAVTILDATQEPMSTWFAAAWRPGGPGQFETVDWWPAPATGSPVLARGLAYLDCRVTEMYGGGDHTIFLGEVLALGPITGGEEPLLWFAGRYRRLAP